MKENQRCHEGPCRQAPPHLTSSPQPQALAMAESPPTAVTVTVPLNPLALDS